MISGPTRWYDIGALLVTAVQTGLSNSVVRAGQVPGDIAWDDCDCGGVLAVTTPRIYLSEVFPQEAEGPIGSRCRAPYEVGEYTVSVIRCAPQPVGQDMAPSAARLDAASAILLRDMAESMDALASALCTLEDADSISDYFVTPVASAGPEGACVGFVARVLISLDR